MDNSASAVALDLNARELHEADDVGGKGESMGGTVADEEFGNMVASVQDMGVLLAEDAGVSKAEEQLEGGEEVGVVEVGREVSMDLVVSNDDAYKPSEEFSLKRWELWKWVAEDGQEASLDPAIIGRGAENGRGGDNTAEEFPLEVPSEEEPGDIYGDIGGGIEELGAVKEEQDFLVSSRKEDCPRGDGDGPVGASRKNTDEIDHLSAEIKEGIFGPEELETEDGSVNDETECEREPFDQADERKGELDGTADATDVGNEIMFGGKLASESGSIREELRNSVIAVDGGDAQPQADGALEPMSSGNGGETGKKIDSHGIENQGAAVEIVEEESEAEAVLNDTVGNISAVASADDVGIDAPMDVFIPGVLEGKVGMETDTVICAESRNPDVGDIAACASSSDVILGNGCSKLNDNLSVVCYEESEFNIGENSTLTLDHDVQTRHDEASIADETLSEENVNLEGKCQIEESAVEEKAASFTDAKSQMQNDVYQDLGPDSSSHLFIVENQVIDLVSDGNNPTISIDVSGTIMNLVVGEEITTDGSLRPGDFVLQPEIDGETYSLGEEDGGNVLGVEDNRFMHEDKAQLPVGSSNYPTEACADDNIDDRTGSQEEKVLMELDFKKGIDTEGRVSENDCANSKSDVVDFEKGSLKEDDKTSSRPSIVSPVDVIQTATYCLLPQEKVAFFVSDLVWGKVKSHPWWPGQIFGLSDASDLALKYQKKDTYLVAYFADKTFAWCEQSQLKPFEENFSQLIKQGNSDTFLKAVSNALGELSRRTMLAMICSCSDGELFAEFKNQSFENAGVRRGTSICNFDREEIVNAFQPECLVKYILELAKSPTRGADRLGFVLAQSQLKAFYSSKGYSNDRVFFVGGGLKEVDEVETYPSTIETLEKESTLESSPTTSDLVVIKKVPSRGRKKVLQPPACEGEDNKKRSISELTVEESDSQLVDVIITESAFDVSGSSFLHQPVKKCKTHDVFLSLEGSDEILDPFDDLTIIKSPSSATRLGSFKIGDCIRRAASQLTGSNKPLHRNYGEAAQRNATRVDDMIFDDVLMDDEPTSPAKSCKVKSSLSTDLSLKELLSQLFLAATNPLKIDNFVSSGTFGFFSEFRNSFSSPSLQIELVETTEVRREMKHAANSDPVSLETVETDHMSDSFWSDMLSNSNTEEKSTNDRKRKGPAVRSLRRKRRFTHGPASHPTSDLPSDSEKSQKGPISSNKVKLKLISKRPILGSLVKCTHNCSPTELILCFNKSDSIPSETELIRIFSRYGPLREAETKVIRKTKLAKVVFRKRADAETAFSSAGKYSIFGPALISYRLRYLSSTTPNGQEDSNSQLVEDETYLDVNVNEIDFSSTPNAPQSDISPQDIETENNSEGYDVDFQSVITPSPDISMQNITDKSVEEARDADFPSQINDQLQDDSTIQNMDACLCLEDNSVDIPSLLNDPLPDDLSLPNDPSSQDTEVE